MGLARFIAENMERISVEWEKFAATLLPAAATMDQRERRDHVQAMLRRITEDLETAQTSDEQSEKAKGQSDAPGDSAAAVSHGTARAQSGYTPDQMVSEFRALRACVLRLWLDELREYDRAAFDDATRFNEAVDQALAESLRSFTENAERSKDLFLGVLGHDLRTPLGAVMMGTTLILTAEGPDWPHAQTATRMLNSGTRMDGIIRDLLDFTRARLGGGIPVDRADMDLESVLRHTIDELATFQLGCPVTLHSDGPVRGEWDRARLGQLMSNLLGNACQHGRKGEPVDVTLHEEDGEAVVAVRNTGSTIEPQFVAAIFEPFRRLDPDGAKSRASNSVGLGLYIAKAIVTAHDGKIDVASVEGTTTFTVRLPRRPPQRSA